MMPDNRSTGFLIACVVGNNGTVARSRGCHHGPPEGPSWVLCPYNDKCFPTSLKIEWECSGELVF